MKTKKESYSNVEWYTKYLVAVQAGSHFVLFAFDKMWMFEYFNGLFVVVFEDLIQSLSSATT